METRVSLPALLFGFLWNAFFSMCIILLYLVQKRTCGIQRVVAKAGKSQITQIKRQSKNRVSYNRTVAHSFGLGPTCNNTRVLYHSILWHLWMSLGIVFLRHEHHSLVVKPITISMGWECVGPSKTHWVDVDSYLHPIRSSRPFNGTASRERDHGLHRGHELYSL